MEENQIRVSRYFEDMFDVYQIHPKYIKVLAIFHNSGFLFQYKLKVIMISYISGFEYPLFYAKPIPSWKRIR